MSTDTQSDLRRERALRTARRRLRLLEIETHRIKAELARLEAEFEDDLADRLSHRFRKHRPVDDRPTEDRTEQDVAPLTAIASLPQADVKRELTTRYDASFAADRGSPQAPTVSISLSSPDLPSSPGGRSSVRRKDRRSSRSLLWSLSIHAAVLLACVPWTFATLAQQRVSLFASQEAWPEDAAEELSDLTIEPADFDDAKIERVAIDEDKPTFADEALSGLLPGEPLIAQATAISSLPVGDFGKLAAVDAAAGDNMAAGAAGPRGGGAGSTTFFGTKSAGDRFVFVVDNSSSMKDGRLEAAIAELVRSVEAMSRRQSFYVIFVSDQTYPIRRRQ
jgi:hypothetical protein